jgi:hypothetical protein
MVVVFDGDLNLDMDAALCRRRVVLSSSMHPVHVHVVVAVNDHDPVNDDGRRSRHYALSTSPLQNCPSRD